MSLGHAHKCDTQLEKECHSRPVPAFQGLPDWKGAMLSPDFRAVPSVAETLG